MALLAENPASSALDLIHDGWREYQYREFDTATQLFEKAAKKASVKEDKLQAMTGQAFCLQFGKRANAKSDDFENAIAIYRECQKIAGDDPKFDLFFKSMIAECSYRVYALNGDELKLKDATDIWNELQAQRPNSLVAQDALLFKTINTTKSYGDPDNAIRMEIVAKQIEKSAAPAKVQDIEDAKALSQVMAYYIATVSFWEGDYKTSVLWLKEYLRLGPTSYSLKNNSIFKVARISEMKLKDDKTAAEYYALFAKSFPVDSKRYFSELKAKELAAKDGK